MISAAERFPLWRRDGLVPPAHLRAYYYRSLNPAAFEAACRRGRTEALHHGLAPHHRVLDIGSGIGNLAIALRDYLDNDYEGIEINREAVAWCQEAITARYPKFRFHHADLASKAYNFRGHLDASSYRFPFPDHDFDFVFLASVFTHMLPNAVAHYISEIARLLRPGGICVASYFLLNDVTAPAVAEGRSFIRFPFSHESGLYRTHDAAKPEAAVAIDEGLVRAAYARAGLHVRHIRRGEWWSGRADDQDVIAASPRPELMSSAAPAERPDPDRS